MYSNPVQETGNTTVYSAQHDFELHDDPSAVTNDSCAHVPAGGFPTSSEGLAGRKTAFDTCIMSAFSASMKETESMKSANERAHEVTIFRGPIVSQHL